MCRAGGPAGATSEALSCCSTVASARSTALRASTLARKSWAASCAGWRQRLCLVEHVVEPVLAERRLHARDHRLDAFVIGVVADLAHAHDGFGAGDQAVDDRAFGGPLLGIDHLEGHGLEVLAQLGQRRHARVCEAGERRQIELPSDSLRACASSGAYPLPRSIARLRLASSSDRTMRPAVALRLALALDHALHVLLERGELAGERRHRRGHVLGLGKRRQTRVEVDLEPRQLLLRRLQRGGRALALRIERVETGRELGVFRLDAGELAVDALRAGLGGLAGLGGRGETGVDLLVDAFAQGVELVGHRLLEVGDLAGQAGELRQAAAVGIALGGSRHRGELLLELGYARLGAAAVALSADLGIERLHVAGERTLPLRQPVDAAAELIELCELGFGGLEPRGERRRGTRLLAALLEGGDALLQGCRSRRRVRRSAQARAGRRGCRLPATR